MGDFTDLTLKKEDLRLTAEQPALLFCEYGCGGYVTTEPNLRGRDKLIGLADIIAAAMAMEGRSDGQTTQRTS